MEKTGFTVCSFFEYEVKIDWLYQTVIEYRVHVLQLFLSNLIIDDLRSRRPKDFIFKKTSRYYFL